MNERFVLVFSLAFACTPVILTTPPDEFVQCADGIDNDGDGRVDGADLGCESTLDDDESDPQPPDEPEHSSIHIAGDFNNWEPAVSSFALRYTGDGDWSGTIQLPAGRHAFKFTANDDWALNWGGGQDDLAPPELGVALQDGADITLELPLGGQYDVSFNEETLVWSLAFDESFAQGLAPIGVDFISLLSDLEVAPIGVDFISLLSDLEGASASQAQSLVSSFIAAHAEDELPLVRGGDVLFLLTQGYRDGLSVAGTFNNFEVGATPLLGLGAAQLGYAGVEIGANQRHAYKITDGANWFKDPQGYEIEWDGFNPNDVGDFNTVFFTEGFAPQGHLRWLPRVHSSFLNNNRDVYVLLPPGYEQSPQKNYPTLYFHDGNESIVRSQMDQVVREQIIAGNIAPLIAVFIALESQDQRFDEYTFDTPGARGHLYREFIVSELLPLIEGQFRTIQSADARGLIGASLGGLISYYIGYERDDLFRRIGGQSSTFFWANNKVINDIANGPKKDLLFYVDSGNPNGLCDAEDDCNVSLDMANALASRNYEHLYIVQPGATHDWLFWNQRLPAALQFLFPAGSF